MTKVQPYSIETKRRIIQREKKGGSEGELKRTINYEQTLCQE